MDNIKDTSYLSLYGTGKAWYCIKKFFVQLFGPALNPHKDFNKLSARGKAAVVLSYPYMGLGAIVQGHFGEGLLYILYETLFWLYMVGAGFGAFVNQGIFDGGLQDVGIMFTTAILIITVYLYMRSVSETIRYTHRVDVKGFPRTKSSVIVAFEKIKQGFANSIESTSEAFTYSSLGHRIALAVSFVVSGFANLVCKQIVKGLLYLAIEVAFVLYISGRGWSDIVGLFTLHTEGVSSDYSLAFGLVAMFIVIAFLFIHIASIRSGVNSVNIVNAGGRPNTLKQDIELLKNKKLYMLFLTIPVVGVIMFTILPLVFMICVAFTNYASSPSFGVIPSVTNDTWLSWTGFMSFANLFKLDTYFSAFTSVLGWTLIWAFFATFTCYFGGLFLALLIHRKFVKCKALFRSIFVVTIATPQLVTMRVMFAMFHDQGPINSMLVQSGHNAISFWGDTNIAKVLIILINMWVGIPYFMVLLSGLLSNIPQELYESARIEGASKFYAFRKITMPYLLYSTTPLLITNFVSNINNFNVIWLLTGGGPAGSDIGSGAGGTDILITWLYKLTMQSNPNYNLGSAIGIIMFIISAGLSLLIYRNSSSYKREGEFS